MICIQVSASHAANQAARAFFWCGAWPDRFLGSPKSHGFCLVWKTQWVDERQGPGQLAPYLSLPQCSDLIPSFGVSWKSHRIHGTNVYLSTLIVDFFGKCRYIPVTWIPKIITYDWMTCNCWYFLWFLSPGWHFLCCLYMGRRKEPISESV